MFHLDDLGGGVKAIVFDRPNSPHNFMNEDIVAQLHDLVRQTSSDDQVKGVILASNKASFVVGGDLKELQALKTPEDAAAIIAGVQACMRDMELAPKPFVAAINGLALGGGLELALACSYRIAADDPRLMVGLPEVSLGLIPGAGGTQRLPRLIGLAAALPIMIEDKQVSGEQAEKIGLVDERVAADQLRETAKQRILDGTASSSQPWDQDGFKRPDPQINSVKGKQVIDSMLAKIGRKKPGLEPAPKAIMTAVQLGFKKDIDEGLQIERLQFASVASGVVVKNKIRTLFQGIPAASSMKDRPKNVDPYEISSVAVIGVGLMGSGIAYCSALASYQVYLLEASQDALDKGIKTITKRVQGAVERNRMTQKKADALLANLTPSTDYADIADVDIVVEAVAEIRSVKDQVIKMTAEVIRPGVPIASNTSTMPITGLADSAQNPESFIGMHFFSPVDRMKLVEVIKGEKTDETTLARALDFAAGIRKTPIVVNDGLGFFTSRVVNSYSGEAFTLLAEGISPFLIDDVALKAGMPVGPMTMADATTITLLKDIVASMSGSGDRIGMAGMRMTEALARLVDDYGRSGKAEGKGIFDYDETGQKEWPGLAECFPPMDPPLSREVIEKRLLHPQALEAVRALEEGIVSNAIDADVGSVIGWAF
ncbi:MAG: 3-hydroxyacyl-CoA dehydrogenase NAD-binding domain-containing protein, partial [Rhodospirillales bacterium]|nr:3-hydroxyacyl-CoA dehydrogenase NAD-binding domain-containing protein [Rhodospirillales bacterium]